jgi:hypothetical protein
MGEVGDGAIVDFAILAEGFAEEDGGRGVAVGDDRDVHATILAYQMRIFKSQITTYMTTYLQRYACSTNKTGVIMRSACGTSA